MILSPRWGGGTTESAHNAGENVQKPNSLSQVVRNAPPLNNSIKLDYVPLPEGVTVVTPPLGVLKKVMRSLKIV